MKEEMDQLVAAGRILPRHVPALTTLIEAGFCQHRSWGIGRIRSVDGETGRLVIDFAGKPGHTMDLQFSAESLQAIPAAHILARRFADLEGLRRMAALNHLDLVKLVLKSFGGKATVDQIQRTLVPDVIQSDWKKWWEAARSELKKDGHFQIPLKKTEPVVYQEAEIGLADRLSAEFKAAKGLKAKILVATEMATSPDEIRNHPAAGEALSSINTDIAAHLNTMPALALEAIFVRDELRVAAAIAATGEETGAAAVWGQSPKLRDLFEAIPAVKHRKVIESYQKSTEDWVSALLGLMNQSPAKLAAECAKALLQSGKGQVLKDTIARLISRHEASSELLLWFGKERSDFFADILTPEVFRAMITAIERDQFNEKKGNRLRDFILEDQQLLPELIASADIEVIKDLVRTLQLSPSFDDMDKRSLLARVVKHYPAIQSLISGEQTKQDQSILVSWASLERRKGEYEDLVQRRIPANVKDIALARSYGDLRENHEYKAAKETQKVLNRQKHELELLLARARGSDFSNPRVDVVGPGSAVTFTDLATSKSETVLLWGAWDGAPERNILSYLSPMAQSLINGAVGAEINFKHEGHARKLRIDRIEVGSLEAWAGGSGETGQ
jgi:transcription elongation GreA/GreB family factor